MTISVKMLAKLSHRHNGSILIHLAFGVVGSHLAASGRQDSKEVTSAVKPFADIMAATI